MLHVGTTLEAGPRECKVFRPWSRDQEIKLEREKGKMRLEDLGIEGR